MTRAKSGDAVVIRYTGKLEDDSVFHTSEGREPEVGQRLRATRVDGRKLSVTVKDASEKSARLDAKYPLAGKDLTFDIQLMEIV